MKFLFIGHRGSGKTTCLKKLQEIFKEEELEANFFDLDQEIESRQGSLFEIFKNQGESVFRKLEKEIFEDLLSRFSKMDLFISVGAGFEGSFPKDFEVIWLRRESDLQGRIFLDRPPLNPELSPLKEWQKRFKPREEKFKEIHQQVLTLPEGEWLIPRTLRAFFSNWYPDLSVQDAIYEATLLPEDFKDNRWEKKFFYRKARRLEVREDLLSPMEQEEVKEHLLSSRVYYSRRKRGFEENEFGDFRDWDLSLGKPVKNYWSYSLHEGEFKRARPGILKWAPEVKNFKELYFGHQWMAGDPKRRVFLPRSLDGRWRWYRRLFTSESPIYFLRDYKGSSLDQPFWYEALLSGSSENGFAAVLGGKVSLSWTPSFHADFFENLKMPVVSVNVEKDEFVEAFSILKKLGLKAAAVTSPLKHNAFDEADEFDGDFVKKAQSANTLWVQADGKVKATSTDLIGLKKVAGNLLDAKLRPVVWGGGGMLPILRNVFPQAEFVPARQGGKLAEDALIVWSSLRSDQVKWPEPLVRVKKVLDLNYSENSMGKELALKAGCPYISGREFFAEQAKAQQDFWTRHFLKDSDKI